MRHKVLLGMTFCGTKCHLVAREVKPRHGMTRGTATRNSAEQNTTRPNAVPRHQVLPPSTTFPGNVLRNPARHDDLSAQIRHLLAYDVLIPGSMILLSGFLFISSHPAFTCRRGTTSTLYTVSPTLSRNREQIPSGGAREWKPPRRLCIPEPPEQN